ncbi:hypothetical protein M8J76_009899 [Diaphorina citri]|nr:hypothetical protein M8J75_008067 [Diaphorina citri]KAI5737084.1 hypothetical protein M8J76_009899 [Diaphorina citri]KAI5742613.1 hypothetical protein M8J77_009252 [Diaphorina citri]
MLSRRENLLIAPWQRRRYLDHRRKVQSALPAIDVKSPESRDHVTLKRKKIQKEYERCKKIEHDNFILLKHLDTIMTKCRVDNTWETPPPDFLHRIAMFPVKRRKPPTIEAVAPESPKTRKERCVGCTPKYFQNQLQIIVPEARIPYEPPKPRLSRRRSSVLAQEEMKKEIHRLQTLDQDRKKQKSEHFQTQRSISCSSQRTNSSEINQSPRRPLQAKDLETLPKFPSDKNAQRKKITSQINDLKLSTVQTFTDQNNGVPKKTRKIYGGKSKMKQIELKKDALELVLVFPAQSKIARRKTSSGYGSQEECRCPKK